MKIRTFWEELFWQISIEYFVTFENSIKCSMSLLINLMTICLLIDIISIYDFINFVLWGSIATQLLLFLYTGATRRYFLFLLGFVYYYLLFIRKYSIFSTFPKPYSFTFSKSMEHPDERDWYSTMISHAILGNSYCGDRRLLVFVGSLVAFVTFVRGY